MSYKIISITKIDEKKRGGDYILTMKVDIHEDLRVKIPPLEHDENVPEFVRNFDFTMVNSSLVERKGKKKDIRKKVE